MHRNRKALFFAVLCAVLIGMAISIAFPAGLLAKRRPASLSEVVTDEGSIEPLGSKATSSDVLDLMTTSHERWQSLYAVVDIEVSTESDVTGYSAKPQLVTEEVWLGGDNQARIVTTDSTSADGDPTLIAVSDGKRYTIYNIADQTYFAANVPNSLREDGSSAGEPVELPPGPVTFPHPTTMLLPARSLPYLLSTGLGQSLRKFEDGLTVLRTERVGNRDAVVLDAQLSQDGRLIKHMRLWVDREYGVILRAQHFSGDSETYQLQMTVYEISFNFEASPDLFSLELPTDATRLDSPIAVQR